MTVSVVVETIWARRREGGKANPASKPHVCAVMLLYELCLACVLSMYSVVLKLCIHRAGLVAPYLVIDHNGQQQQTEVARGN